MVVLTFLRVSNWFSISLRALWRPWSLWTYIFTPNSAKELIIYSSQRQWYTVRANNPNFSSCDLARIELTEQGGVKYQELVGWADLEVFHPTIGEKKSAFNQGTCRELTNETAWTNRVALSTAINYNVLPCEPLLQAANLLDESMLCGSDEILPGILGRRLPNSTDEKVNVVKEKSFVVEVFNIQVNYPQKLENEILTNCKAFRNGRFSKFVALRAFSDVNMW